MLPIYGGVLSILGDHRSLQMDKIRKRYTSKQKNALENQKEDT